MLLKVAKSTENGGLLNFRCLLLFGAKGVIETTKFKPVDIESFTRLIVRWLPEINSEFVYETLLKLGRCYTVNDVSHYVRFFEKCLYEKEGDLMSNSAMDSNFIGYCDFDYRCCLEIFVMIREYFGCLTDDEELRSAYDSLLAILSERLDYPKCADLIDEKIAVFGTL